MKNQKFHSKAWLNQHKVKEGNGSVYIRIYVNGSRAEVAANFQVPIKQWCSKTNRVKNTLKEAVRINASIDKIEGELKKHFLFFEANEIMATATMIKQKLKGIDVEDKPLHKTIMEAFDYHNLKLEEQVKIGKVVPKTHTRYKITKNKVKAFFKFFVRLVTFRGIKFIQIIL